MKADKITPPGKLMMKLQVLNMIKCAILLSAILFSAWLTACSKPPQAFFTASRTEGPAPLTVHLTNESLYGDSFTWDFGDGNTTTTLSIKTVVEHEYTKSGTYTIALTAHKHDSLLADTKALDITVTAGALAAVVITPNQATLAPGETGSFVTKAIDRFGNDIPDISFDYTAANTAGQIGPTGNFTSGSKAGLYENAITVTATKEGITKTDTAQIRVTPGPLDKIKVMPPRAALASGGSQVFEALAYDAYENPITSDLEYTFTAEAAAGQIGNDGTFTASKKAGNYNEAIAVTVKQKNIVKTATVDLSVEPGPLDHIILNPAAPELSLGDSQTFSANAFDTDDNLITDAQFVWVCDQAAGTIAGNILTAGTTAGTFYNGVTVTAIAGEKSLNASATLFIKPDPLDTISISLISIQAGETQQIKVETQDKYGNQVTDVATNWRLLDSNAGSVTTTGLMAAGTTAYYFPEVLEVTATQGALTKTGRVSLQITPGPLSQVIIGPGEIELGTGMTQQFVAAAADQYGNRIADISYNWSVTSGGGTIDNKGHFTAAYTAGTYYKTVTVMAKQGSIEATASANVTIQPERIAYVSFTETDYGNIYLMNTDGTNVTKITNDNIIKMGTVTWSPNGRQLAYDALDTSGQYYIMITGDNGEWTSALPTTMNVAFPAWSPDGRRIAFTAAVDDNLEIFIGDIDGGNITRLTYHTASDKFPVWSPDGTKIAFVSNRDTNSQIYIINVDGTGLTRLRTTTAEDTTPAWSPDGSNIVFETGTVTQPFWTIATINVDGTGLKNLTPATYNAMVPSFSRDGSKIIFHAYKDNPDNAGIYIMDVDGNNIKRLSSAAADDYCAVWGPAKQGVAVSEAALTIPRISQVKPMTIEKVAAKALTAVVRIETEHSAGSGFIIDPNGLILTANHVITGANAISVYLDNGMKYIAIIRGRDILRDIAILQINANELPYLSFGDTGVFNLGQEVVIIGYPLGTKAPVVSNGIISSIQKDSSRNITWIQTNASVNPGNSGGPILNMQGEIIGVVLMKMVGVSIEGIGYAISASTITIYLERILAGETIY